MLRRIKEALQRKNQRSKPHNHNGNRRKRNHGRHGTTITSKTHQWPRVARRPIIYESRTKKAKDNWKLIWSDWLYLCNGAHLETPRRSRLISLQHNIWIRSPLSLLGCRCERPLVKRFHTFLHKHEKEPPLQGKSCSWEIQCKIGIIMWGERHHNALGKADGNRNWKLDPLAQQEIQQPRQTPHQSNVSTWR